MQYNIGDKVEIIGHEWAIDPFSKGDIARVTSIIGDGFMWIEGDKNKVTMLLRPRDVRPFESIAGGVDELRARHQPAPPDRSKVTDLQPGATDPNDLYRFNHTENSI